MKPILEGRTLAVINDLSLDEQLYLLRKTGELKKALKERDHWKLDTFKLDDPFDSGFYTVFLEKSTRTKESFINAAAFHGLRHRDFPVADSSLGKDESLADTFRMLYGYDDRFFVVRSTVEGLCRHLERDAAKYVAAHGVAPRVFLNGGDGKHEHPTQELLDEFTFLERNNFDRSHLHVALVGDLLNGRTVHSKADGLRVFKEVTVDLVAPPELALPNHYVQRMLANGFQIRTFPSLAEYLDSGTVAPMFYMTRDQLERMDASVLPRIPALRAATKLSEEQISQLLENVVLYHPLPMNSNWREAPLSVQDTPLEGWNEQSRNGYLTRIVLLSAFGGRIGEDFDGEAKAASLYDYRFLEDAPAGGRGGDSDIKAIRNGIVIDHICRGDEPEAIYVHRNRIMRMMGFNRQPRHFEGVTVSKHDGQTKGYISLTDYEGPLVADPFDAENHEFHKLGAMAPGCTVNVIAGGRVVRKIRVGTPPRIYGFDEARCSNGACISQPEQSERIVPSFTHRENGYACDYCDTPHAYQALWRR